MVNELNYGKQQWDFKDVNDEIDEFMELYKKRPIISNRGGDVIDTFILDMVCF